MQSLLLTGLNMRTILKNAKQVTVATLVPSHQLFFSCWLSKSRFSALSVTAIKKTTYTYIVRVVQNIWSATRRAFLFKQQPYPPSTKTLEPKFFSSCTRKWNVLQNERAQNGMCSIRNVLNMASDQTGMCSKWNELKMECAQNGMCSKWMLHKKIHKKRYIAESTTPVLTLGFMKVLALLWTTKICVLASCTWRQADTGSPGRRRFAPWCSGTSLLLRRRPFLMIQQLGLYGL